MNTLKTKFGEMEVIHNDPDFAIIKGDIVVNGVPYNCVYRLKNFNGNDSPGFSHGEGKKGWHPEHYSEPYLSRHDSYADPTRNAKDSVRNTVLGLWREHISAHPELTKAAQKKAAEDELASAEEAFACCAQALEEAEARFNKAKLAVKAFEV